MPYEKVQSIVNFYSYFTTELKGEFKINVCVGTCRKAPVVTVNGKDFNGVTLEDVSLILKECN